MSKTPYLPLIAALAVLFVFSGCASKTKQNVRVLQAQVGAITEELVRLDESLQATRSALQAEESNYQNLQGQLGQSKSRISALRQEEEVIRGIYRTPSGFELPSIQIQQALKNAGYYRGSLDGKIGPMTRESIEAFQRDQGLTADGVVGRNTWAKLKGYLTTVK